MAQVNFYYSSDPELENLHQGPARVSCTVKMWPRYGHRALLQNTRQDCKSVAFDESMDME